MVQLGTVMSYIHSCFNSLCFLYVHTAAILMQLLWPRTEEILHQRKERLVHTAVLPLSIADVPFTFTFSVIRSPKQTNTNLPIDHSQSCTSLSYCCYACQAFHPCMQFTLIALMAGLNQKDQNNFPCLLVDFIICNQSRHDSKVKSKHHDGPNVGCIGHKDGCSGLWNGYC